MSMPATHGHSEACCNIPPIISKGYSAKGHYEHIDGLKTYVSGEPSSSRAVLAIYDIFGFSDQILQGADILAHGGYRTFMPDWFHGNPCPREIFPPDTAEKKTRLAEFFASFSPQRIAQLVPSYIEALRAQDPSIQSLAIIGYCWGAKVAVLASTPAVGATGMLHPAMLAPLDARALTRPVVLLASKDEPRQAVADFEGNIPDGVARHVEVFADQIHGWMAARADLEKDRVREEYERGYCVLLEFLGKHV